MKKLALFAVSFLIGAAAHAEGAYVDVAYQTFDSGWSNDPAAVRLTGGYVVHPNFAVEGMLGMNIKKGKETVQDVTATIKVDNMIGIYLRPMYNLSDSVEIYGRLGYARIKIATAVLGYKDAASDSDFSYGVGIGYSIDKNTRIFGDYTKIADADALAFGVGFRF